MARDLSNRTAQTKARTGKCGPTVEKCRQDTRTNPTAAVNSSAIRAALYRQSGDNEPTPRQHLFSRLFDTELWRATFGPGYIRHRHRAPIQGDLA